uniref:uncharacterized protein LOC120344096 isoform X1 n=1 Tax=Styela clava TaxID=7725 RepID=UPI00193A9184|nr:uncharacterized protein LOC120344096 isoform X1 [Styela clava]
MKIPIRHSFIGLILLMKACLLIKAGEKCRIAMICDGKPTWKDITKEGQCTKEEEKALEALTEHVDETKSMLYQLQKRLEDLNTNSGQPFIVGVNDTTTTQGYTDKNTSLVRTSTVPATSPWSTKEAFLSTLRPQTTKVEQRTECGVVYNSSCIRAIVYDVKNVTFSVAESICENKLANIYDVTHYNLVRDYLRSMIPDGLSGFHIHTGMTYNHSNGQLYSTTGQVMSLPTEFWSPDTPYSYAPYTGVGIVVNRNPKDESQGIFNYPSWGLYHGVICENES